MTIKLIGGIWDDRQFSESGNGWVVEPEGWRGLFADQLDVTPDVYDVGQVDGGDVYEVITSAGEVQARRVDNVIEWADGHGLDLPCLCGRLISASSACHSCLPLSDMVIGAYVPRSMRGTARACGRWDNLASCLPVDPECWDDVVDNEPDWAWVESGDIANTFTYELIEQL